jgi:hypothetical protein
LTISIDFWNFPILGHFYEFLKLFTTIRAIANLFWAFSIDFWGKKGQISPELVQNFPKRASRFNKGSKSIEKKQKNKKELQR